MLQTMPDPSEDGRFPAEDEYLDLIQEWGVLTLADVDPQGHAWRSAYREAKRLVREGKHGAAGDVLARACVYPNTHRQHFVLLLRLWRHQNVLDRKAGRPEAVRQRVLAMVRKVEALIQGLADELADGEPVRLGPLQTQDLLQYIRKRDAQSLLWAARAVGDAPGVAMAREWMRCRAYLEAAHRTAINI
ncbi:MAG TPA: hypothetical protein VN436_02995 [Holophaga sp.]|nr:hypothetical protein [Holophaga sp.]